MTGPLSEGGDPRVNDVECQGEESSDLFRPPSDDIAGLSAVWPLSNTGLTLAHLFFIPKAVPQPEVTVSSPH